MKFFHQISSLSATSATSAKAPQTFKNYQIINTDTCSEDSNISMAIGGMAEVAEVAETKAPLSTAYTFSDKLVVDDLSRTLCEISGRWTDEWCKLTKLTETALRNKIK